VAAETEKTAERIAELNALVEEIRERVRMRYPRPDDGANGSGAPPLVRVPIADLMPVVHARDAAQAKVAAIGSVNPRAGGLLNRIIQALKKAIARGLQWFVRDQVAFNRETVAAIEAVLEALNEHNRTLVSFASQVNEQFGPDLDQVRDIHHHWIAWRTEWERKLAVNEVQFLRAAADIQGAFQHRVTLIESNFREIVKAQHSDYLGALDRTTVEIQMRLASDFDRVRAEYARLIHDELRIIRLRTVSGAPAGQSTAAPPAVQETAPFRSEPPLAPPALDYTRFAYRFRGSEDDVRRSLEFYKPFFRKHRNVLDIGCGRGEFLEMMRDVGVTARGIDLSEESVAQCREKGLAAEVADMFPYLAALPEGELDGILLSQVVEHIDPMKLPGLIRLCGAGLAKGGILAVETPNPECLAIFATYFYLDPTHSRPVPHPLMEFYMEEASFGYIEVHKLSPAVDSMPEIAELPEAFRERFFGGLDYAIIGYKL
jgi:O-antigen chain-terminating methyltransferase